MTPAGTHGSFYFFKRTARASQNKDRRFAVNDQLISNGFKVSLEEFHNAISTEPKDGTTDHDPFDVS